MDPYQNQMNLMHNFFPGIVLSWILNSVSQEIASSIIYIDSAEEMWNDIKERFSQQNGPRIFQL